MAIIYKEFELFLHHITPKFAIVSADGKREHRFWVAVLNVISISADDMVRVRINMYNIQKNPYLRDTLTASEKLL